VPQPEPFVDIHCHLIPGIDDGAKNWDETLAMARMAVVDGIGTIVVTPHQLGNYAHNDAATVRARTSELQTFLEHHRLPLRVLPGADVRIESDLAARIARGEVMSLADRRRHILLELPHELYIPLDRLLGELAAQDLVGILSHPERNAGILKQTSVVRPLVAAGCLMQVTAGSLLGAFGGESQKFSEWLIEQGLVHFISTDAHGPKSRRPLMRHAFNRVVELGGWETAIAVCCKNPAAVAAGQSVNARQNVAAPTRPRPASRLGTWLGRWSKAS
jgi:protein-tyrosine phosphatase